MRDCIFLLADKNMEAIFEGFLGRPQCQHSLDCGIFTFDPQLDIIVDTQGNDPGIYSRAHEFLHPYLYSHKFAIIALDCAWNGSPGKEVITSHISANMLKMGWEKHRFVVIAIDPEIEMWVWQENPHVTSALRYTHPKPLRDFLCEHGYWPKDMSKPLMPKETLEWLLKITHRRRTSALYREIASKVSLRHCQDPSFQKLVRQFQHWFPK
jgi:hypothetical protein